MSGYDEASYAESVRQADRIEQEPWLMQAGAELWRRLLAVTPKDLTMPETLMALAKLPPTELEAVLIAIAEEHPTAADRLAASVG